MIAFLRALFLPRPGMAGCTPPTEAERLAAYERRLGEHKALERLRQARVAQLLDERAAVRPVIRPKLPEDRKVIP